jgi:hypothetical protein
MKSLFIITTISQLMLDTLLHEQNESEVTVVTPYDNIAHDMFNLGISCFPIKQKTMGISDMDKMFAEEMLPGVMESYGNFPGTDLPVWKVLSLDRLKFWFDYGAKTNLEFIRSIEYDRVYVSLDLDNPYPWNIFPDDAEYIAIKTNPIRTAEFVLYSPRFEFDEIWVDSREDEEFLKKIRTKTTVRVKEKEKTRIITRKQVKSQESGKLDLGFGSDSRVIGVMFDKRDEWQTRLFLSLNHGKNILLFPVDTRSRELARDVLHEYKFFIQSNEQVAYMCDEVVAFRWDDRYTPRKLSTFKIIDYGGMNMANVLAPDGIVVE